ncbi:MAG TPA: 50S ribosomal protein L13 [Candidatus Paceibacterota bacterium]|jgi:large subunit ribosomal protein L13|nr:50S ribosomal protein L13 [Candidatus Paceibacterota bacterium]HPT40498.1 50S ribosomal protein L13 [Candidatus Paceibacterota bacterium]
MKEYKFNASNQILGRLATQIASLLQGKNSAKYEPNQSGEVKVIVDNISKIRVTGKKQNQKLYRHHTGYIGHLKTETYKQIFEKNPSEILRKAVMGMLPKNKLRSKRIKNLIIND